MKIVAVAACTSVSYTHLTWTDCGGACCSHGVSYALVDVAVIYYFRDFGGIRFKKAEHKRIFYGKSEKTVDTAFSGNYAYYSSTVLYCRCILEWL